MTNQEILANAPEGWVGIYVSDGFYRWIMENGWQSKIICDEAYCNAHSHERSRSDIERIVYLESVLKGEAA
tara:strand:- start:21 stop:233 length:213 start_codon:yes stop_codon:yes gene_type:complete